MNKGCAVLCVKFRIVWEGKKQWKVRKIGLIYVEEKRIFVGRMLEVEVALKSRIQN